MMHTDSTDSKTVYGLKDESKLTMPQIEDRSGDYVLRILSGAFIQESLDKKLVHIRSCGNEYVIEQAAYQIFKRIADRVENDELKLRGIHPPFNVEDTIRVYQAAQLIFEEEVLVDLKKLRVLFLRCDEGGCGWYRVMQPVRALKDHPLIEAEFSPGFMSLPMGKRYDMIVAQRVATPEVIGQMINLQRTGRLIVYETDDHLEEIPKWNHLYAAVKEEEPMRREFMAKCDGLIASTPELGEALKHPNTQVCMNGIDENLWPMKVSERVNTRNPIRILWGGSNTHRDDLNIVVPAIKELIREFKSKIEFVFVHYFPEAFRSVSVNIAGVEARAKVVVDTKWAQNIKVVPGVKVYEWPKHMAEQAGDIMIAPLCEHPFNNSKSELRVLEAWALGIPCIASDVAPYRRAIKHGENGILVGDSADMWVLELRRLIIDAELRRKLAENGLKKLRAEYGLMSIRKRYAQALITMARGKVSRPECAAALDADPS